MRIAASLVLAALLAVPAAAGAAESARPRVATLAGVLEGVRAEGGPGAVFKGVPYAQPPVGPLRWREPQAVVGWSGVREATSPGPACVQIVRNAPTGEEDCLYLNVWTPEWPVQAAWPVMLWLFGGANYTGSANNPVFDGAALARRGVVVVTINHRVGALGFMAHPELTTESPHKSSGNYALLDQIAALQWVQQNITRFGGDPRNVTLFGQSSGSFDLLLLMTSPLAKGLFSKAIAQSGNFLAYDGPMPKARAEGIGRSIAADLSAPEGPGQLAFLRSRPAYDVATAAAKWLPTMPGTDTGLLTNIDGWALTERPDRAFAQGRQAAVPLIIGNNAREISFIFSPDQIREQIAAKYGPLAPEALVAYGLADGGQGHTEPLMGGVAAQWMTDIVQRCPAGVQAEWHAAKHPTWRYQFERSIPGREAAGSSHGAEVAFVWGQLDKVGPERPAWTASDYEASQDMQAYWTNFAKTGDPNSGGGLPAWPRAGDGRHLAFTADGPTVKSNLQPAPCAVFKAWTDRRLADQGSATN